MTPRPQSTIDWHEVLDIAREFLQLQQTVVADSKRGLEQTQQEYSRRFEALQKEQIEISKVNVKMMTLMEQLQSDQNKLRADAGDDRKVLSVHAQMFAKQRGAYLMGAIVYAVITGVLIILAPMIRSVVGYQPPVVIQQAK